ncbi:MAG: hydrogenase maturation nickel metallochaperone HypA [Candidatus Hodarchaeales archaeon]|jgi:hydrogenase nickel incorporation protein HypA/HybF
MHEFSLAQSVQETVISIAKERAAKEIKKVILKFGAFALIEEEQFRFCFDILKKESSLLEAAELEIIWISGELRCQECNFEGKIEDTQQKHTELAPIFQCPTCKSYATDIISGTEATIDSIVID